jgi:hypothetical protein
MFFIIQDLVFKPDGRPGIVFLFRYKIFDAAVGTFSDPEFELQPESAIFFFSDDVASVSGLTA